MTTYQSVFSKITVPDPEKLRNAVLSGKRAVPWYRRKSTYGGIAAALACIAVAVLVGHTAFPEFPDTSISRDTSAWSENTTTAGATTDGAATTVAGSYGNPTDLHLAFTLNCTLSDERRTVPIYAELPDQPTPVQYAQSLLDKFGMNLDVNDYITYDGIDAVSYNDGVYDLYVGHHGTCRLVVSDDSMLQKALQEDKTEGKLIETTTTADSSKYSEYKPLSEAEYLEMAAAQLDAWGITLPEGLDRTYTETEIGGIIDWDANNLYNERAFTRGGIRIVFFGDEFYMFEYCLWDIPSNGTQEIISEQEAYERLPEDARIWVPIEEGTEFTIDSCTFEYSPITTNNPEPVYVFHTTYKGNEMGFMVPAMP